MTLENLVRVGKLVPHEAARDDIARLLSAIRRNLKDAGNPNVSPETRFDVAYKAVMQAGLAALMASGFRPSTSEPGHHATVIQSLPKTIGLSGARVAVLDKLRRKRNLSDYTGEGVSEVEAASCMRAARELTSALESWLRKAHPELIDEG
jgi:hypothetical protein